VLTVFIAVPRNPPKLSNVAPEPISPKTLSNPSKTPPGPVSVDTPPPATLNGLGTES
jgi:hypothetical protein